MTKKSSNKVQKRVQLTAGLLGALSVIVGAFAAHALKDVLDTKSLDQLKTATQYGFIHALLALISLQNRFTSSLAVMGGSLFSYSIFIIVLLKYHNVEVPFWIGVITPIGGTLMIISWATLIYQSLSKNEIE